MSWYCVSSLLNYDLILTCLWHYRRESYQLIASTKDEHLSIVVLDSLIASRSIIKKSSSSVLIFASCSWQKNCMFQSQSREISATVFSERSNLTLETITLARQLKALLDANLHKRRVKSTSREILEIVCRLYSDITSKSVFEKTKNKIKASKELDHSQEQFLFDWMMNLTLITTTVKTFLVEIRVFRDYLAENFGFAFSIQSFDLSIDDNVNLTTLFISSEHSSAEREKKSDEIESLDKDSDSDESREIFAANSVKNIDDIEFNSSQTSSHSQSTEIDILESLTYSNQDNSVKKNQSRSTQMNNQTSIERVHSTIQRSRVQSEKNSFQSSHLRNLKELFITQRFFVATIISVESENTSNVDSSLNKANEDKTFSKEYSINASSIVFQQYSIQSFQEFISRNFDFLESILLRTNTSFVTRQLTDSSSVLTNENLLISIESYSIFTNFDFNKKEAHQNKITNKRRKIISFSLSTTSQQSSSHVNFFILFSSLLFDSLFQQFRSSFSLDSFTSSAKSVSSNKLSAELHSDFEFSRIEKLNEQLTLEISSEVSSSTNQSTNITSIMSIFDENNASSSFVFNLTQQNIQEIALFMFNLFAQNVQDQTQAKVAETINETIINIA